MMAKLTGPPKYLFLDLLAMAWVLMWESRKESHD